MVLARVRLRLYNMSMMRHPIHLHGHFFQVLSCDERRLNAPIVKDTITLGHMETAELQGSGFRVHAVSIDKEDSTVINAFREGVGLTFHIFHDPSGAIQGEPSDHGGCPRAS